MSCVLRMRKVPQLETTNCSYHRIRQHLGRTQSLYPLWDVFVSDWYWLRSSKSGWMDVQFPSIWRTAQDTDCKECCRQGLLNTGILFKEYRWMCANALLILCIPSAFKTCAQLEVLSFVGKVTMPLLLFFSLICVVIHGTIRKLPATRVRRGHGNTITRKTRQHH